MMTYLIIIHITREINIISSGFKHQLHDQSLLRNIAAHLVRKYMPTDFCRTGKYINMFTIARHWPNTCYKLYLPDQHTCKYYTCICVCLWNHFDVAVKFLVLYQACWQVSLCAFILLACSLTK